MANNKVHIKGFTPYAHQKAVIDCLQKHPTGATIVVRSSRQKGKTLLMSQLLLKTALEHPGTNSVIIEPTTAGCRRVMKEMNNMLANIPIVKSANFQYLEIEFVNGSIIQFRSGESRDGLRGISLKPKSLLILDEAAFLVPEVYGIVLPFANVHKNTKIIVSTPLFEAGDFYEHFKLAEKGESNHYLIDFNNYDTSMLISQEQLDEAKKTMSYQSYCNEYLGMFLQMNGAVFGDFQKVLSNVFNRNNNKFYVGVDWGSGVNGDYTAISVFNSQKEQVYVRYFNDKDVFSTINEVIKVIKDYNPVKVTVEANSIGEVNYQLLIKALNDNKLRCHISKFQTTNDSKRRIVEALVADIQQGSVQLLDETEMKLELATYDVMPTRGGTGITYNAKTGHDDLIIATCICLDSMRHSTYRLR